MESLSGYRISSIDNIANPLYSISKSCHQRKQVFYPCAQEFMTRVIVQKQSVPCHERRSTDDVNVLLLDIQ